MVQLEGFCTILVFPLTSERMLIYKRRGEVYAYSFNHGKKFEAMEVCIKHGLDDDLDITLGEAGSLCRIMEESYGYFGHNSG